MHHIYNVQKIKVFYMQMDRFIYFIYLCNHCFLTFIFLNLYVYSQTKLSLIARVTAWLLAIPDTLFFQPAFPFSDYCLERGKAQSATDRPAKS